MILVYWFLANKLTLNINKSAVILFGKHGCKNINISIGNETISQTTCTKFLGLWIDENLNWKEHTHKLLQKLEANVNLLKTGRKFLSPHALKVLYFAQIHSNLTYGIGIWGSLISREMLSKLQHIQNNCFKILGRERYMKDNVTSRILTVEQQVHLDLCKLWHKKALGLLPVNLDTTMGIDHNKSLSKTHKYHTRQKNLQN